MECSLPPRSGHVSMWVACLSFLAWDRSSSARRLPGQPLAGKKTLRRRASQASFSLCAVALGHHRRICILSKGSLKSMQQTNVPHTASERRTLVVGIWLSGLVSFALAGPVLLASPRLGRVRESASEQHLY